MEEKRRFPRYNRSLEVEYSPKGRGVIYSHALSKNISKGGICIPVLSRLVRTGDSIKIDIYPGGKRIPISAKGEVVWTKETSVISGLQSFNTEAGIKFTEVDAAALDGILQ